MNKKQSKKLKKSPKKNFLFQSFGLGTILLTAFSMFSSGFSSWVIVREGEESINLGLEVENTVNVANFISFVELERDYIEITPKGFVINETLINGEYAFKFDVPFEFELDLATLYPFLTNTSTVSTVSLIVTLKNKNSIKNFWLFQDIYMASPENSLGPFTFESSLGEKATLDLFSVKTGKSIEITLSFPKPISPPSGADKKVKFKLYYHFDFSRLGDFEREAYGEFPDTGNPFEFILEVKMSI